MSQLSQARAAKLIDLVYDSVTSDEEWFHAIDEICRHTGAVGYHQVVASQAAMLVINGISSLPASADAIRDYEKDLAPQDARMHVSMRTPVGTVMFDDEHFDASARSHSLIYSDWLPSQGLLHNAVLPVYEDVQNKTLLGLLRAKGDGPFDEAAKALLLHIAPHVVRASRLREKWAGVNEAAAIGHAALAGMPQRVAVLDAAGAICFTNPAAERLLADSDWCKLEQGCLRMVAADDQAWLSMVLTSACRATPGHVAPSGALVVKAATGRVVVSVLPVRDGHPLVLASSSSPLALVIFSLPDEVSSSLPVLREMLGLTPAETRVAAALASGATLAQIAVQEQSSEHTLRTHLKNLMRKTGHSRQLDLISLIKSIQAPAE